MPQELARVALLCAGKLTPQELASFALVADQERRAAIRAGNLSAAVRAKRERDALLQTIEGVE